MSEEAAAYDRNIHVSIENGVFDERDYFVAFLPKDRGGSQSAAAVDLFSRQADR
ncbi:MAG: hypothetical protein ACLSB9_00050 [Hydrogeniiclostridium mannosilyticum]